MLSDADGLALCRYARACIAAALGGPPAKPPTSAAFAFDGACFVTLYRGDELHGCIGSLEAHQPLLRDVADNAVSAALRDPRATPIVLGDEQQLRVEVSLLSDGADLVAHVVDSGDGVAGSSVNSTRSGSSAETPARQCPPACVMIRSASGAASPR